MTQRFSTRLWPLLILALAAFLRLYRLASVPFGWHPDEATKALLARDVLAGKFFPAFFSAFTGREALFVYLEAGLFSLIGEHIFVGRLLSAFIGIMTVAATYATGKLLFNRRLSSLAAAFLTVSLWHLIASRNGYRAVIQPLIQLPVIWFLFRGLQLDWMSRSTEKNRSKIGVHQRSSTSQFILAGFFLGLTQYTYTAVRVFPFLIVAVLLLGLLYQPRFIWQNRLNLFLMALVAFLVFLPLGWHFWQNPTDFYGRAAQISVFSPAWSGGAPWVRLWQSIKETGRMWSVWGDINFRFNIKGQPVFGPFDGALFYFGLLLCVWRVVRPDKFLQGRTHSELDAHGQTFSARASVNSVRYGVLLLWLLIMLLPMILSAESLPYYQRAIGVLPAVYFFPAITLDWLLRDWRLKIGDRRLPSISNFQFPILLLLFGWLTLQLYNDYFDKWHRNEQNDDDRRVAMVYVADYLREHVQDGALYLSTQYMQHPTLALLAPQLYDGIHWFDARQSLPLPPEGSQAVYLLLAENAPQPQLLKRAKALIPVHTENDRFGRPVFTVFEWRDNPIPTPTDQSSPVWSWETSFEAEPAPESRNPLPLPVNFGNVLLFEGHDRNIACPRECVQNASAPGDMIELVLYWQTIRKPARQYTFFAHMLNVEGRVVAGFDANDYPTSFWYPGGGERLLSYSPLTVPPDALPGIYQIEIGVYNQPTGERLPVLDGDEPVADRLLLAPVEVR